MQHKDVEMCFNIHKSKYTNYFCAPLDVPQTLIYVHHFYGALENLTSLSGHSKNM